VIASISIERFISTVSMTQRRPPFSHTPEPNRRSRPAVGRMHRCRYARLLPRIRMNQLLVVYRLSDCMKPPSDDPVVPASTDCIDILDRISASDSGPLSVDSLAASHRSAWSRCWGSSSHEVRRILAARSHTRPVMLVMVSATRSARWSCPASCMSE